MLKELALSQAKLKDSFWSYYVNNIKEKTIPYQYKVMDNSIDINIEREREDESLPAEKSNAIENFRIAAGINEGEHYGWFFQDSDVYKWLEAVAYSLEITPDKELEELADSVIELIGKAQEEDGYLDTFFQLKFPNLKYRELHYSHELYCAGHLIEAAIGYTEATGKSELLTIALKVIDHIEAHFGYEEGKIQGADGHQEIELALVKLYEFTGEKKYLALANFFTDIRGKDPKFYEKQVEQNNRDGLSDSHPRINLTYLQAYTQPKNQTTAEGHAVRMLYMATGMARIAKHTNDEELLQACKHIWTNVTTKKMYVTAGVGSTVHGEAFTGDYDLPNDTMYCETCASIALIYFAYELFKIEPKAEYMAVIERALYNGILSGAAIDGEHFFYVNPLEVYPAFSKQNPGQGHVKTQRPEWLGCACCPPNFARTIGSIQRYLYTWDQENKTVYSNLFVSSETQIEDLKVEQRTEFPKSNRVSYYLSSNGKEVTFKIRIPEWTKNAIIRVNGVQQALNLDNGYAVLKKVWEEEVIELTFETPIFAITANPNVVSDVNRLAVQRGPFVYCAESIDNEDKLQTYHVNVEKIALGEVMYKEEVLNGVTQIKIEAKKEMLHESWESNLYQFNYQAEMEKSSITLIPYYAWGNRGEGDMLVWLYK
ncbi:glycoside hydrolase family 127 protein [Bacillus sp. B1-b2]|uniref:glycoside hydrolase family 127 protein n=1 Tax=Bacillus sp. B1-b2 TaxID=2653201 RepID=UPI0012621C52|nr:beta-L-arabinofuranosidase domain-containing protein [Bacillus sp. B1-b2]KAB7664688.1 glycoside hydrolase family 127 protein [Bacillus sp. B1-b2]